MKKFIRECLNLKTAVTFFGLNIAGIIAYSCGMVYYTTDSIGYESTAKDVISLIITVGLLALTVICAVKKNRPIMHGLLIYSIESLVGAFALLMGFMFTGLGLFQPCFCMLSGMYSGLPGIIGPMATVLVIMITSIVGLKKSRKSI